MQPGYTAISIFTQSLIFAPTGNSSKMPSPFISSKPPSASGSLLKPAKLQSALELFIGLLNGTIVPSAFSILISFTVP